MENEEEKKRFLSVAIITKNEEKRLPDCLKSVAFADEVVVVDSGSEDNTVAIAKSFGANVVTEPWRGFSGQKQFAVDLCRYEWVLIVDADERIHEETAKVINLELSRNDGGVQAYRFRRKNYLHGRWIKHAGFWPDRIVRLVNRKRGDFDGRPVHEKWVTDGRVKDLDAYIEHFSFKNYSDLLAKMETYSNLGATVLFEKNKNSHVLSPIFHGVWTFFRTYILELGLLDGFDGFMISVTAAGGSFLKYAKLREMRLTQP